MRGLEVSDVYLVRALTDDGKRHYSTNCIQTICGVRVGWELSKAAWKKRPACTACNENG